jgi:hypothetical protein
VPLLTRARFWVVDNYRKWRWYWRLSGYECDTYNCRFYWNKPSFMSWKDWHDRVERHLKETGGR